jgi:hypothetical protein
MRRRSLVTLIQKYGCSHKQLSVSVFYESILKMATASTLTHLRSHQATKMLRLRDVHLKKGNNSEARGSRIFGCGYVEGLCEIVIAHID